MSAHSTQYFGVTTHAHAIRNLCHLRVTGLLTLREQS